LVATKYERTSPAYPTPGPSDDEDWASYFKRIKGVIFEPIPADEDEEDEEDLPSLLSIEPHEVEIDECPSALQAYAKLAKANDWFYKLGHSQTFTAGVPYKGGAKAGEMRNDKTVDHYWINGHKKGKGIFSVSYDSSVNAKGATVTSAFNRNINRVLRVVPDAEMKAWLKSD
jgi:hypothetical protein